MRHRLDYGHRIEAINDAVRVSKHHHTYFLEGDTARMWWRGFLQAERRGRLSSYLDRLMVELGQYPV